MEGLALASHNVNGLNIPTKRKAIFQQLREVRANIAFIQESHSTDSVAHLWKAEWGGKVFFNHGLLNSRGVAILFSRDFNPTVAKSFRDPHGRIILLDVELDGEIITVGSVNAPTQNKPDDQMSFLGDLQAGLETMTSITVYLAGDFNCILDPKLDKNSLSPAPAGTAMYRNGLRIFMEEALLSDVWRVTHPEKSNFTFRRAAYASRLDFFLVSSHVSERVSDMKTQVSSQSDHSLLSIRINKGETTRGPGIWKFDTTLLTNDDFLTSMSEFLTDWVPPPELDNPSVVWDWCKFQIKLFVTKYSKNIYSREKQTIRDLQKELNDLTSRSDRGSPVSEQIDSVRRKLKQMEDARANKLIFRSRCRWAQLGEKPSAYFLNLEKRQAKDRTMSSIMLPEENRISTDPRRILQACADFYSRLYAEDQSTLSPTQVVQDAIDQLDHPKLSDQARDCLEAPPTTEELKKALKQLNFNKSPGTDGLPPEFYIQFWDLLSPHLIRSYQYSFGEGLLSVEQRRGVVTLIPKKDVDRCQISNWRPVTLLNTDYKIWTKMMALRLQPHLEDLIHYNQTGFLKGRFIGDNTRSIEDAIHLMRSSLPDGLILALDFTKAFDSVRWDFIRLALRWFGFGPRFSDMVVYIVIYILYLTKSKPAS